MSERSKLMKTKEDLLKIGNVNSNNDVIGLCTRERAITQWNFRKLTNKTSLAPVLKKVSMGSKIAAVSEPLVKNPAIKCLIHENRTLTIYVSSELQPCICMKTKDSCEKLLKFSIDSQKILVGSTLQTFEVLAWKISQQWRTFYKQMFFCMTSKM